MEKIIYKIYEMLGDYFTGSSRRRLFWIPVFIIFIFSLYIGLCYKIVITQDTLYWVFSSIVQSLLALVALLIVASIFKLQLLHNREEKIIDEMRLSNSPLNYYTGRPNEVIIGDELIKLIAGIENPPRRLKEVKKIIEAILLSRDLLKDYILKFTVYNSFVVGLSLFFLIFTPLIFNYYLGVPILYLIAIFFAYSLFLVIKGVAESLW